jgi:hypothetical protein
MSSELVGAHPVRECISQDAAKRARHESIKKALRTTEVSPAWTGCAPTNFPA